MTFLHSSLIVLNVDHASIDLTDETASPASPHEIDWSKHYPDFVVSPPAKTDSGLPAMATLPTIADIGCGFGGLLIALSPLLPSTLMLGMELRTQVLTYVTDRIYALRSQNCRPAGDSSEPTDKPQPYTNISALRTNTMKFLPNFFHKAQLEKIFLCFPDPHFKARKHKARIVSAQLNSEYAYALKPGGKVYTITDVEELGEWMAKHFEGEEAGPGRELWERVSDEENEDDICVATMTDKTEEGMKVSRNGGKKFGGVWRRLPDPVWKDDGDGGSP